MAVTQADLSTLALLIARNLVNEEGDNLSLHQVVADVAMEETHDSAVTRHREHYFCLVQENPNDRRRIQKLYGQVKRAWDAAPEDGNLLNLLEAIKSFQSWCGLWHDQLTWANRVMETAQASEDHASVPVPALLIGEALSVLGELQKALEHFRNALPVAIQTDVRVALSIIHKMANVYSILDEDKALNALDLAFSMMREMGLPVSREVLAINWGLGHLIARDDDSKKRMLESYDELLQGWEVERGEDQMKLLSGAAMFHLRVQKDPMKALEYLNQSLDISKRIGDRLAVASTLGIIGQCYVALGNWERARDYFCQSLPVLRDADVRLPLSSTLAWIGQCYVALGNWERARDYFHEALPMLGEVGFSALEGQVRRSLAMVYNRGKRPGRNNPCYCSSGKKYKRCCGRD